MTKKNTDKMQSYLDEILPRARCELNYSKDYELLISVMLSAQTTDKKVNQLTEKLYQEYKTLEDFENEKEEVLEEKIRPLGLSKAKANYLKDIVHQLLYKYDKKVPSSKEELMTMKGVGNKVANVILIELFDQDEFPVDTHIFRISKRLGLADEKDSVIVVEKKLREAFPKQTYKKLHHQMIHFGRYFCKAKNPSCKDCKLQQECIYFKNIKNQ